MTILLLLFSIAISVYAKVYQRKIDNDDSGVAGFTRTCPGSQGNRQRQTVGCYVTFWGGNGGTQVVGCCLGGKECYDINPCEGGLFMCGDGWCEPSQK